MIKMKKTHFRPSFLIIRDKLGATYYIISIIDQFWRFYMSYLMSYTLSFNHFLYNISAFQAIYLHIFPFMSCQICFLQLLV